MYSILFCFKLSFSWQAPDILLLIYQTRVRHVPGIQNSEVRVPLDGLGPPESRITPKRIGLRLISLFFTWFNLLQTKDQHFIANSIYIVNKSCNNRVYLFSTLLLNNWTKNKWSFFFICTDMTTRAVGCPGPTLHTGKNKWSVLTF